MIAALYGGTPIEFIPDWIADTWRVVLWCSMVLLIGRMLYSAKREKFNLVLSLGRIALLIFVARAAWFQANNWHEPAAWDGLPVLTVAIAFAWAAAFKHEKEVDYDSPTIGRLFKEGKK